jgi:DNA-binding NarL/FixJ family response regulator
MSNRTASLISEAFPMEFQIPEPASPIWASLIEDAHVGVMIVDAEGQVRFANSWAEELVGVKITPGATSLREIWPEELAKERLDHVRESAATARPMAIDGMIRGRFVRTIVRPLGSELRGRRSVLMVFSPANIAPGTTGKQGLAQSPPTGGMVAVRARVDDPGKLADLTTRELEILKLIGAGLSTADIAKHLHRSVKTVEWHRVSLGNKLGVANRVELARIAIAAGLVGLADHAKPEAPPLA